MRRQIPLLTPIRGFSALIVAYFHARLVIFPQWLGEIKEFTSFLENAYIGVDIFFILSGYVMMHVYRNSMNSTLNWGQFMWLRFSRIYPLFLATFGTLFVWECFKYSNNIGFYGGSLLESWGLNGIPAFQGPFNTTESILSNLMLLQGITPNSMTWNFPGWSLSIEWLCYMLFPLLLLVLVHSSMKTLWLPALGFLSIYSLIQSKGTLDVTSGVEAFMRGMSGFSLGAWLNTVRLNETTKRFVNNDVFLIVIFSMVIYTIHLPSTTYTLMTSYFLFAVIVLCNANQADRRSLILKLLDNKATQYLGDISYSVYLWHSVLILVGIEILNQINPEFVTWWYQQTSVGYLMLSCLAFAAVILPVSALSYHWIERPALRLLRKKRTATMLKKSQA
ncbi:acyltransferase [Vibrio sp. Of7-15]|uniref:acyltransferase family protein n=1 Tax=Vibrio sp. Of7-15 TaxID=2724879 RepID=UPI001EF1A3B6|nr:acyltransferase [Vibrio sp. Of7-15]MCG7497436.1 acyltransferase [Vibrio sp. Of7-15]